MARRRPATARGIWHGVAIAAGSASPRSGTDNRHLPMVHQITSRRPARRRPCGRAQLLTPLLAPLLACLLLLPARVAAEPPLGLLGLARWLSPEPACTRTQVLGLCWCGPNPCGYLIRMYVPVAFGETVRAPGDSLLSVPLPAAAGSDGTLSSSHSGLDNTAEAHAWVLGNAVWLLAGRWPCLACQPSDARSVGPPPSAAADLACGAASSVVAALVSSGVSGSASLLPSLAYASEADAVNWRTGCRDLFAFDSWRTLDPAPPGRRGSPDSRPKRRPGTPPGRYSGQNAVCALRVAPE